MENGPQNQTILDGKDATLTCNAVAAPIPNTTWIYNGKCPLDTFGSCKQLMHVTWKFDK